VPLRRHGSLLRLSGAGYEECTDAFAAEQKLGSDGGVWPAESSSSAAGDSYTVLTRT